MVGEFVLLHLEGEDWLDFLENEKKSLSSLISEEPGEGRGHFVKGSYSLESVLITILFIP